MSVAWTILAAAGVASLLYWLHARRRRRLLLDEEHVGRCEKCGAEIAARTWPLAMWDVERLPDGRPVALLGRPHPCFNPAECLRSGAESTISEVSALPPELQKLVGGHTMTGATCKCTSKICGHPNGEPCAKPVENPLPMQVEINSNGPTFTPESLSGLCEECLCMALLLPMI